MSSLLNQPAPDFKLLDQNEKEHQLKDYQGKYLLIFFYPKDMTSGCTIEAQNFQASYKAIKDLGVELLGVSADEVKRHQKFAEKEGLTFPLLADTEKEMVQQYKVWVEKSMYGRKYMGIQRDSFLINPEGMIIKHYQKVKPKTHINEVLKDLSEHLG